MLIKKFVQKYKIYLVLLPIIAIYFLLRLPNLTLQPIFADEAIYVRWAQVMKAEPTLRFLPLSDGKTPLFMWIMMPMFKIFSDPLYAGRFLSVISGFITLIGVFVLGSKVFNLRIALVAALFYATVPYIVFFDRMALVDSMLAAFSIWSLITSIWILKNPRFDLAMILGYLLGGALLVKTPAMLTLLALPLTIVGLKYKEMKDKRYIFKLVICWGIALFITLIIYNLLRLGPGFYQLSARNADYVFAPSELIGRPLDPFIPHLRDIREWLVKLIGVPISIFMLMGIILVIIKRVRLAFVVLVWVFIPFLLETAFLRTFTARYLLFCVAPMLTIASFGANELLDKIKISGRVSVLVLLMISLPYVLWSDYLLLNAPEKASLPINDRMGYLEDWTAGYGLKDIADYLKKEARDKGTIIVGTEGSFGTLPDGLQIYLEDFVHSTSSDKQIIVMGGAATISAQLRKEAGKYPTYFVGNSSRLTEGMHGAIPLKVYKKAESSNPRVRRDAIILFKVYP